MQTRVSLLARIQDINDGPAWSEFVQLYAPLIHAYGMKSGLQDTDAADLTQDTLRLVMRAAPDFVYDPKRGSFRGWLYTVARNEIRKFARKRKRVLVGTGDSEIHQMLEERPQAETDEEEWDQDYQMNLFRWVASKVQCEFQDRTWLAFWRTVVLHQQIKVVAEELGLSVGAVYIARSRVTMRIRQEISAIKEP